MPSADARASRFMLLVFALPLLSVPSHAADYAPSPISADRILKNGKIWTVNSKQPEAEALAIQGERIVAVGSDSDVLKLAGPKTIIVDLHKRRVVPGFHDSHLHLLTGGMQVSQVSLKDAKDEVE